MRGADAHLGGDEPVEQSADGGGPGGGQPGGDPGVVGERAGRDVQACRDTEFVDDVAGEGEHGAAGPAAERFGHPDEAGVAVRVALGVGRHGGCGGGDLRVGEGEVVGVAVG